MLELPHFGLIEAEHSAGHPNIPLAAFLEDRLRESLFECGNRVIHPRENAC